MQIQTSKNRRLLADGRGVRGEHERWGATGVEKPTVTAAGKPIAPAQHPFNRLQQQGNLRHPRAWHAPCLGLEAATKQPQVDVRHFRLIFLLFFMALPAQAATPLDTFVAEVLARNPSLRAADSRRLALHTTADAEGRLPDPSISLMADRFPDRMAEMPMLRLQAQQMLPWPGKLALLRDAADAQAQGSTAAAETRRLDIVFQAKQAWFMLAMVARRLEVNRMTAGLLSGIAKAARARYGAGTGGHHELMRAEVEKNANEVEREALEGERISAVAMLNVLRDQPTDAAIADPAPHETPLPHLQIDKLTALALANRPEFHEMEAMVQQMHAMAAMQRKERLPDLMVGVWWNSMMGGPDTVGAMVGGTLPIFGRNRQGLRADAAMQQADAVGHELAAMQAMVRFQVADALRKIDTANHQLAFLRGTATSRAKESLQSAVAGYATGSVDITGLLDARRALQVTENALVDAVVQRELAIVQLERTLGGQTLEELK